MQDKREIPAIVTEKIVIKCCYFPTLDRGTSLAMALRNRQTTRLASLEHFSSSIDKVSFKKKKTSMSLGLVVLEKLFTWAHTPTP